MIHEELTGKIIGAGMENEVRIDNLPNRKVVGIDRTEGYD